MTGDFVIAGVTYGSRLLIGTARYPNMQVMLKSVEASGAEIVTVGIRRLNMHDESGEGVLDLIRSNAIYHFAKYCRMFYGSRRGAYCAVGPRSAGNRFD